MNSRQSGSPGGDTYDVKASFDPPDKPKPTSEVPQFVDQQPPAANVPVASHPSTVVDSEMHGTLQSSSTDSDPLSTNFGEDNGNQSAEPSSELDSSRMVKSGGPELNTNADSSDEGMEESSLVEIASLNIMDVPMRSDDTENSRNGKVQAEARTESTKVGNEEKMPETQTPDEDHNVQSRKESLITEHILKDENLRPVVDSAVPDNPDLNPSGNLKAPLAFGNEDPRRPGGKHNEDQPASDQPYNEIQPESSLSCDEAPPGLDQSYEEAPSSQSLHKKVQAGLMMLCHGTPQTQDLKSNETELDTSLQNICDLDSLSEQIPNALANAVSQTSGSSQGQSVSCCVDFDESPDNLPIMETCPPLLIFFCYVKFQSKTYIWCFFF